MKIIIPNNLNTTIRNAMRQCGFFENFDRRTEKISYIRKLDREFYPRFHCYISENKNNVVVNLHIDQKKASYKGYSAHSGEYDSDVVRQEGQRIKTILENIMMHPISATNNDTEDKGFFGGLF